MKNGNGKMGTALKKVENFFYKTGRKNGDGPKKS